MKTIKEILERCRNPKSPLSFDAEALINFLPYEEAKEFLKEGTTAEQWNKIYIKATRENVIKEIREYMEFALGKAENHRGLSAIRSIEKMNAWIWLLDDEDKINWDNYANYGAPILKQICELYNLPFPDNKTLVNMSQGKPCYEGCEEGCGQ